MSLSEKQLSRYSRQLTLEEVGVSGQEKLLNASVLIIGIGGLGCVAAQYLVASGVGSITLVDGDTIDQSNLQRQILYGETDCRDKKVEVAKRELQKLNSDVKIKGVSEHLTAENALPLFHEHDIVLDCSDNFGTRYLVNDAAVLSDTPFVTASILRFEGQIALFIPNQDSEESTYTYRDLYPEPPISGDVPSCSEAGVLGPLAGVMGSMQAAEALHFLVGMREGNSPALIICNLQSLEFQRITLPRSGQSVVETLQTSEEYVLMNTKCDVPTSDVPEITVESLKKRLDAGEDLTLIDVREPFEREIASIGGELIPVRSLEERVEEIPREGDVVVYCRSGGRSGEAVKKLQSQFGYTNVKNLVGGVLEWSDKIDPSMPKY